MKDHVVREVVSELVYLAQQFSSCQQLRSRISGFIVPVLKGEEPRFTKDRRLLPVAVPGTGGAEVAATPRNQCDGCRRGLPVVAGIHRGSGSWDLIGCTAALYEEQP